MTFEEVLDQAMAMLQRRGRLTYRTLQLHFQLDDEHLEALKDELIYGQRLAVDEDGRVLVWTGGAEVPQPAPPPASQAKHGQHILYLGGEFRRFTCTAQSCSGCRLPQTASKFPLRWWRIHSTLSRRDQLDEPSGPYSGRMRRSM
jgi:hypothetical protein